MVGGTVDGQRRLTVVRLFLPFAVAVRLIAQRAAEVAIDPHRTVPVVAVEWAFRRIDRNMGVVDAEPVTLGIAVGEQSSLQHLVRREADAWYDIGGIESGLLNFGKVVGRVAVQLMMPTSISG